MIPSGIEETTPLYTLKMASILSGVPAHSIRQYVDRDLVLPYTTESQRHLFSQEDILRLKCITYFLREQKLNIAGIKAIYSLIPCWYVKNCPEDERVNCPAYKSSWIPCWQASNKDASCRNLDCRSCEVYRLSADQVSVKEYICGNHIC